MIAAQLRRVASREEREEAVRVAAAAFDPSQAALREMFLEEQRVRREIVRAATAGKTYIVTRPGTPWA